MMTPEQAVVAPQKQLSRESTAWDKSEKGFLTDAQRLAKTMDGDGKGYLSREEAISFAQRFQDLTDSNRKIVRSFYALAALCILLFVGTILGSYYAVQKSKETTVDPFSGALKVHNGNGLDVSVQAHGLTFHTGSTIVVDEKNVGDNTTIFKVTHYCVSGSDVMDMWLANENGIDARLVTTGNENEASTVGVVTPVTTGEASWTTTHVVMGGLDFVPSEACKEILQKDPDYEEKNRRRSLLSHQGRRLGDRSPPRDDYVVHHGCEAALCDCNNDGNFVSCCNCS